MLHAAAARRAALCAAAVGRPGHRADAARRRASARRAARCWSRSAFSEVEIGVEPQPETVLQPMRKLDGYRVVRAAHAPHARSTPRAGRWRSRCRASGWPAACSAAGRRDGGARAGAAGRLLRRPDACLGVHRAAPAATRHRGELSAPVGATSTLMQRRGDALGHGGGRRAAGHAAARSPTALERAPLSSPSALVARDCRRPHDHYQCKP
ncbi:MAG: hypothetical protein MZW92_58920 [Comamonadaceae bacterium]|nr:hypothetical protein [Comamonadaceae bacterium]